MKRLAAVALFLVAACHKKEPAKTEPASPGSAVVVAAVPDAAAPPDVAAPPPAPPVMSATDRAKQIVDAQVAAIVKGGDAILETFGADATVLVPDARAAATPGVGLREAIARLTPHQTLKSVTVGKLVAGGNAGAVWWSGELTVVMNGAEEGEKAHDTTTKVHVTELATQDAGWKVVAGAFAEGGKPMMAKQAPPALPGATEAGSLAPLLAGMPQLDATLGAEPTVFGTEDTELAYGATAARALIAKWSTLKLSLEGKPREVTGKTWGFVEANVNYTKAGAPFPSRMVALLIAASDGGAMQVVAVQYNPI